MRRARIALTERLADRIAAQRESGDADAGVALMLVIMVMLVVATLGIMVTTAVVSQVKPTVFEQRSTATVYAAEAGLQAGLNQLRSAKGATSSTGTTYGDPSQLPCSMTGAVTSKQVADNFVYAVTFTYYADDPTATGLTAAQKQALVIPCTAGRGTSVVPGYALVSSVGTKAATGTTAPVGATTSAGDRQLQSLYTFKRNTTNTDGGLIYTFSGSYCLQAVTASASSKVVYVPSSQCVADAPQQTWEWDADYRIRLSSSVSTANGGLCLTGSFSTNTAVTLTTCSASRNDQLFSFEGGSRFRGQNSDNTGYGTTCLWSGAKSSALDGSQLMSGSDGCSSQDQDWGSFAPDARVGAGNASKTTNQIVNYQQFGRCFDVTDQDITKAYMILYPCKQDPSSSTGASISWNQKIIYADSSTPQQLKVTTSGGTTYCLVTPTTGVSPAYVTFAACITGSAAQQWVRTGEVTGDYADSYTFTDTYGRCLSVGDPYSGRAWSTIVAATCDGTAAQKWNAPANAIDASVSNTREVLRGS